MDFKNMSLSEIEEEGYRLYNIAGREKRAWKQCTDCFLYLVENAATNTKKAQYGNTLGYIFYYGRTNDFQPEYDKAFKYFSIGAEGGFFESIYKLGDMYLNGLYVEKDPERAVKLYTQVYEEVEHQFREEEFRGVFADISLRLGGLYRKGIGCKQDDYKALFIFTMAEYAIKERMKNSDFFGNRKVADSIAKELAELQEKLGVDTGKKFISADYPLLSPLALTDGYAAVFSFKRDKDKVIIEARRLGGMDIIEPDDYRTVVEEEPRIPRIPVIFSEYGYLKFCNTVSETAVGVTEFEIFSEPGGAGVGVGFDAGVGAGADAGVGAGFDAGVGAGFDAGVGAGTDVGVGTRTGANYASSSGSCVVDEIRFDDKSGRYEFCMDGNIVAAIKAEKFEAQLSK